MAHRMQITLTDDQYATLRRRSAETGVSIAELVRRRLGPEDAPAADLIAAIEATAGLWSDREETGAEYVDRMRPGVEERLRRRRS